MDTESAVMADARRRRAGKDAKEAASKRRAEIRDRLGALRLQRKLIADTAGEPTEAERILLAALADRAAYFRSAMRGKINAGRANSISFDERGALEFFLGEDVLRARIHELCGDQRGLSIQGRAGQLAGIDNEIAQLESELRTFGG